MGTRRDFVAWLSALSLTGLARPLGADQGAEEEAVAAARVWLNLVDGGRYATSWEAAAPGFRNAVTQEQWDQAVHSVRTPLGRCLSRTLRSHKLVDSLPGTPKGPYVVLQFETDFEHREDAVETVTPALGRDDRWRVASYFIR
jgi:serine/threonine-protein kinase